MGKIHLTERILKVLLLVGMTALLANCSLFDSSPQYRSSADLPKLSTLLIDAPKEITRKMDRSALEEAVANREGRRSVRIVRIYRRNASTSVPEYRVFDVQKGGAFYELGIRSGDVIIGVNDRVVVQAQALTNYPKAVLIDGSSTLTFRRGEELLQLNIEVTS